MNAPCELVHRPESRTTVSDLFEVDAAQRDEFRSVEE